MFVKKIEVVGDTGTSYSITTHDDGVIMCTCPAWKYATQAPQARTCKHIKFVATAITK
jgi:hypothetical protein